MISTKGSTHARNDRRIVRTTVAVLIVAASIVAGVWRLTDTAARTPALDISYPASVTVGQSIDVMLQVRQGVGIGGYQTRLYFDTSQAHLAGVDHTTSDLAQRGRFIQTLGPSTIDGGASFGLFSCPTDECGAAGKPVDKGADGDLHLATVTIVPDRAGTLAIEFSGLRFVDASGAEVTVEAETLTLSVTVAEEQE